MRITTKVVMQWDGSRYTTIEEESFDHEGPLALCCGASDQQNQTYDAQSQMSKQIQQQGQQVFGDSSKVFTDLMSSLAPTIAAGSSQEGFSAAEKANLNSQAITQTGISYRNAKAAVGNAAAAQGGGNTGLEVGSTVGRDLSLAESAANQTSNELSQITENDYAVGRQNYDNAIKAAESATNVFSTATGYDTAATNSLDGQATTANQIAQQDNSWVQSVTGALGGIAGAAAGGWFSGLAKRPGASSASV